MIDKDAVMKDVEERFSAVMIPLAREIDGRINFALRQIMIRYGNMLFI